MGCLYRLTFPSGKAYIGITAETAQARFAEHVYNAKRGLGRGVNRAMRKYGHESVRVETLVIANDWDALCEMERRAIAAFNTKGPHGYNMTDGGEGALGYRHTPEALLKMGAVHKGGAGHTKPHTEAAKAKMSAAGLGRVLSAEHRRNISQSQIGVSRGVGRKHSQAHRDAIGAGNLGKKRTEEQRARISIAAAERERQKREQRSQSWM